MALRYYYSIIIRRKWAILATFICIIATMLIGTYFISPVYRASVILRVATTAAGSIDYLSYDMRYADRIMRTYAIIATSYPLLSEVRTKLNLDYMPDIDVETISETELMQISVESNSPVVARDVANTLADQLIKYIKSMYHSQLDNPSQILLSQIHEQRIELDQIRKNYQETIKLKGADSPETEEVRRELSIQEEVYSRLWQTYEAVRARDSIRENAIMVVEPALIPQKPVRPNWAINSLMAVILGILGSAAAIMVLENLEATSQDKLELEQKSNEGI